MSIREPKIADVFEKLESGIDHHRIPALLPST
jgi:hypothetical protein